jgi:hypothetical protein
MKRRRAHTCIAYLLSLMLAIPWPSVGWTQSEDTHDPYGEENAEGEHAEGAAEDDDESAHPFEEGTFFGTRFDEDDDSIAAERTAIPPVPTVWHDFEHQVGVVPNVAEGVTPTVDFTYQTHTHYGEPRFGTCAGLECPETMHGAVGFNGQDRITIPGPWRVGETEGVTFIAKLKVDAAQQGEGSLFSGANNGFFTWTVGATGQSSVIIPTANPANPIRVEGQTPWTTTVESMRCLAVQVTPESIILFDEGIPVGRRDRTALHDARLNPSPNLYLGQSQTEGVANFNGRLYDFRYYHTALHPAMIASTCAGLDAVYASRVFESESDNAEMAAVAWIPDYPYRATRDGPFETGYPNFQGAGAYPEAGRVGRLDFHGAWGLDGQTWRMPGAEKSRAHWSPQTERLYPDAVEGIFGKGWKRTASHFLTANGENTPIAPGNWWAAYGMTNSTISTLQQVHGSALAETDPVRLVDAREPASYAPGQWTLSLWTNPDTPGYLAGRHHTYPYGWDVALSESGQVVARLWSKNDAIEEASFPRDDIIFRTQQGVLFKQWNHVALVYDAQGPDITIYVNGQPADLQRRRGTEWGDDVGTLDAKFQFRTGFFYLGEGGIGPGAVGRLDEVGTWDRIWDPEEVMDQWRRGSGAIRLQVRVCADDDFSGASCGWQGPDGTPRTYFSEANNTEPVPPTITLATPLRGKFFQYRVFLRGEAKLMSVALGDFGPADEEREGGEEVVAQGEGSTAIGGNGGFPGSTADGADAQRASEEGEGTTVEETPATPEEQAGETPATGSEATTLDATTTETAGEDAEPASSFTYHIEPATREQVVSIQDDDAWIFVEAAFPPPTGEAPAVRWTVDNGWTVMAPNGFRTMIQADMSLLSDEDFANGFEVKLSMQEAGSEAWGPEVTQSFTLRRAGDGASDGAEDEDADEVVVEGEDTDDDVVTDVDAMTNEEREHLADALRAEAERAERDAAREALEGVHEDLIDALVAGIPRTDENAALLRDIADLRREFARIDAIADDEERETARAAYEASIDLDAIKSRAATANPGGMATLDAVEAVRNAETEDERAAALQALDRRKTALLEAQQQSSAPDPNIEAQLAGIERAQGTEARPEEEQTPDAHAAEEQAREVRRRELRTAGESAIDAVFLELDKTAEGRALKAEVEDLEAAEDIIERSDASEAEKDRQRQALEAQAEAVRKKVFAKVADPALEQRINRIERERKALEEEHDPGGERQSGEGHTTSSTGAATVSAKSSGTLRAREVALRAEERSSTQRLADIDTATRQTDLPAERQRELQEERTVIRKRLDAVYEEQGVVGRKIRAAHEEAVRSVESEDEVKVAAAAQSLQGELREIDALIAHSGDRLTSEERKRYMEERRGIEDQLKNMEHHKDGVDPRGGRERKREEPGREEVRGSEGSQVRREIVRREQEVSEHRDGDDAQVGEIRDRLKKMRTRAEAGEPVHLHEMSSEERREIMEQASAEAEKQEIAPGEEIILSIPALATAKGVTFKWRIKAGRGYRVLDPDSPVAKLIAEAFSEQMASVYSAKAAGGATGPSATVEVAAVITDESGQSAEKVLSFTNPTVSEAEALAEAALPTASTVDIPSGDVPEGPSADAAAAGGENRDGEVAAAGGCTFMPLH